MCDTVSGSALCPPTPGPTRRPSALPPTVDPPAPLPQPRRNNAPLHLHPAGGHLLRVAQLDLDEILWRAHTLARPFLSF